MKRISPVMVAVVISSLGVLAIGTIVAAQKGDSGSPGTSPQVARSNPPSVPKDLVPPSYLDKDGRLLPSTSKRIPIAVDYWIVSTGVGWVDSSAFFAPPDLINSKTPTPLLIYTSETSGDVLAWYYRGHGIAPQRPGVSYDEALRNQALRDGVVSQGDQLPVPSSIRPGATAASAVK
jgi:hypothetical protein